MGALSHEGFVRWAIAVLIISSAVVMLLVSVEAQRGAGPLAMAPPWGQAGDVSQVASAPVVGDGSYEVVNAVSGYGPLLCPGYAAAGRAEHNAAKEGLSSKQGSRGEDLLGSNRGKARKQS